MKPAGSCACGNTNAGLDQHGLTNLLVANLETPVVIERRRR